MVYGSESGGVWNMALRVEVCGILSQRPLFIVMYNGCVWFLALN